MSHRPIIQHAALSEILAELSLNILEQCVTVRLVPRLTSVIVAFTAWLVSVPVGAAEIEQNGPVLAAKTILEAIVEAVAMLNRCREVDSSNTVIYNGLIVTFGLQNTPVIERLDQVLRGEGVRAGHGETYFLSLYPSTRVEAQEKVEEVEAKVGSAKFLDRCRSLPDQADQQTDMFTPLRDRFPVEMRTIDAWR